jgi:hypothetical protein
MELLEKVKFSSSNPERRSTLTTGMINFNHRDSFKTVDEGGSGDFYCSIEEETKH